MKGNLDKIASFIVNGGGSINEEVVLKEARYRLLDWVCAAKMGTSFIQGKIVENIMGEIIGDCKNISSSKMSLIIGSKKRLPVLDAVMINAIYGHSAEIDDGHRKAIGHPGAVVFPVALSLAEIGQVSVIKFLQSIIIGYEIFIRFGSSLNPEQYKYWHTTSAVGIFAATSTAAFLLDLDEEETKNALSVAASMASGLRASFGSHSKVMNVGLACKNGLWAALLSQKGFMGAKDAVFSNNGYVDVMKRKEYDYNFDFSEYLIGTSFYKKYASCGHTHCALDLYQKIVEENDFESSDIDQIVIYTYKDCVDIVGQFKYKNGDEAKFSLPYCIAVKAQGGSVCLRDFEKDKLECENILSLAKKVKVLEDIEATSIYPKRKVSIMISLKSGKVIKESMILGEERIEEKDIINKFYSYVGSGEKQKKCVYSILHETSNIGSLIKNIMKL